MNIKVAAFTVSEKSVNTNEIMLSESDTKCWLRMKQNSSATETSDRILKVLMQEVYKNLS